MTDRRFLLLALLAGTVLAGVFWWPLLSGGGFVGGDIYSYYFPQKMAYADVLQQGQWPFWNDRTGHGYPVLGESQTGVFYPLHLAVYTWLDVNTAYSVSHLLHYVLAFVFTAGYARRFGVSMPGALLAGLVYVYGWFPCRSCWEWAIIGGSWLPAALWSVECLLQTRRWRFAGLLALVLAVQLLAGHFQLAWITQLVLVVYVPCRLWLVPVGGSLPTGRARLRSGLVLLGAGGLGLGLAAMQLLPTWEFRQVSQRAEVGTHHDLQFGSIPAWYWSQAVMPFKWYSPMIDRTAALQADPPVQGVQTNAGEAHLYFGLAPLVLAIIGIVGALRDGDRRRIFWVLVGTAALFYTTGRLVPLVESLPGFSFFQGPGRYGVVVTLAVALLAGEAAGRLLVPGALTPSMAVVAGGASLAALGSGWWLVDVTWGLLASSSSSPPPWLPSQAFSTLVLLVGLVAVVGGVFSSGGGLDRLGSTMARRGRWLVLSVVVGATVCDLWLISRLVQFTEILEDPPIVHLSESAIARRLADSPGPTRVFSPMANFPTVLGTSSTPVYFTFGPSEYTRPGLMMPQSQVDDPDDSFVPQSDRQMRWLERAGVTHILSFRPIDVTRWPVEEVWHGRDRVMNQVLRHFESLYLYRLTSGRGRVAWEPAAEGNTIERLAGGPGEKTIDVTTHVGARLVLTELMAPGWRVEVDGKPREAERGDGLYRVVTLRPGDSRVRWYYQPPGLYWGLVISGLSLLLMTGLGYLRFRYPGWLACLDMDDPS